MTDDPEIDRRVWEAMALRGDSEDALRLAAHESPRVRAAVARNTAAPLEALSLNPPFWLGGGDFGGG